MKLSVGDKIGKDDPLVRLCTKAVTAVQRHVPGRSGYLKWCGPSRSLGMEALFEKAFKKSLNIWGQGV